MAEIRDDRNPHDDRLHPWVAHDAVRFGIFGGPMNEGHRLASMVQEAEQAGYDSYWAPDHPLGASDWATTLAALAVRTERIRLGPLVVCPLYRHPAVLAREAANIDRLSDGRLVLGLGLGDDRAEFSQMGIPFPSAADRRTALRETIEVLRSLWAGESCSYEGRFVRLHEATMPAPPVQQPWVPLLVAGGGERQTLPLVAELADMSNLGAYEAAGGAVTPDDVRAKLDVLDRACIERGRTPRAVLRSHVTLRFLMAPTRAALEAKRASLSPRLRDEFRIAYGVMATPEEAVPVFQDLIDAGIRYFILRIWEDDLETMRLFADHVMPALRVRAA